MSLTIKDIEGYEERGLPGQGLCDTVSSYHFGYWNTLMIFHPTKKDSIELRIMNKNTVYWGSDDYYPRSHILTELRLTILLFLLEIGPIYEKDI